MGGHWSDKPVEDHLVFTDYDSKIYLVIVVTSASYYLAFVCPVYSFLNSILWTIHCERVSPSLTLYLPQPYVVERDLKFSGRKRGAKAGRFYGKKMS